jgi:uroporphyrinogen decarboxylase
LIGKIFYQKELLQEIKEAVKSLKENLWSNGGCIAQCEFGPGANPSNVYNVFKTWNEV